MANKRSFIANQVFVGLPWKNVRPRYEKCVIRLEKKYPVHFTIVGRHDAQDAEDLLGVIKARIESSSFGIFDATSGNANVSLEYGYAEALDIPRAVYLSTHKANRPSAGGVIISDLGGKRRIEYKNEERLGEQLETLCKDHDYTKRFENFLKRRYSSRSPGTKKRLRSLALKAVRYFDGNPEARREDLAQHLQALNYTTREVEDSLAKLHDEGLINISRGRYSRVTLS